MKPSQLIDLFQRARSGKQQAVIEGLQALKHAVRFRSDREKIITCDISLLENMLDRIAPDVKDIILHEVEEVSEVTFSRLSPQPPRTKVIALAKRKPYELKDVIQNRPIIFLENPRDLENIGAVIRVAAAAEAAAVVASGAVDIWHPSVTRGAAGLQYAIPVFNLSLDKIIGGRTVISLDPTGEPLTPSSITPESVLVFGTERSGISPKTLSRSNKAIRLPMREGVSSLNLATSVAATLYQLP